MALDDFMPGSDSGKCALFLHVKNNLPTHFAAMGLTALTPQVVAQANDALAFDYACRALQTLSASGPEATANKNRLRDGDPALPTTPVVLTFPTSPGAVPTAVLPGVVTRFRALVKWLRVQPGYTEAIGKALQIIGDELPTIDLSTLKPTFRLRINGGRVEIDWSWDGLSGKVDGVEIHNDHGTGTLSLLAIDTRPGYVDTTPFPATPQKWKYRLHWLKDGQRIGTWSDLVEILVG